MILFLHLGEDYLIPVSEIVMIGDLESSKDSDITKEFFHIAEEEGFIVDYSMGNPRSFVMTGETIYLSMISSSTLSRRFDNIFGDGGV